MKLGTRNVRSLYRAGSLKAADGWIIVGWISRRWDVGMWTGLGWPRTGTGGGVNEPSGSIKMRGIS